MKRDILCSMACACVVFLASCGGDKRVDTKGEDVVQTVAPEFCADSALMHIVTQCDFGPRTPGSEAHHRCGDWIVARFGQLGMEVSQQSGSVTAWDGKTLPMRNIMASYKPEAADRVLLCAHWDSRPWADADPDPANHLAPVPAANDGASGVAVMIEIARLIQTQPLDYGVDFVCFDVEDYGNHDNSDSWCLGSTEWAKAMRDKGYKARYGVLFDMVGGRGARFATEGYSLHYARSITTRLWKTAQQLGYSSIFSSQPGGYATDDHVPVNQIAGVPCIDIIPHYEDGGSSFGPTWHTVHDTPENIDPNVLKAVGQSVAEMMWRENQLMTNNE